ncbi:hypothetical protein BCR35DRAFT_349869 [Leucosporidium creatinivorum]|uniref:Insulin-like growth factor binding protein n=1 Tax=Leucosporidium creatinivorum TaxID=106004 RepID=A0A1Y2G1R5_9BASI|nr:hypothetical protein BCR35DRAFT_349869 [Leucosporidium creatinivorum]
MRATFAAFSLLPLLATAAPTANVEDNFLEERGITCAAPQHIYKGKCVTFCPAPGYFVRESNECFSCGKGVNTCNSQGALSCTSATDFIAGSNCVKSCPRGSDLWHEKKKCVPCGVGKYLSFRDGTCVDQADPNAAIYLRFAGHERTALRDPNPDDGATGFKESSSLRCITQVRFTGGHEVDFLGLTQPENNACFNTERTPAYKDLVPGYTSCHQIFFAGTTCYSTTCALPKHLYHDTCVYPCPSPGYYKADINTCFDCGKSVKSCNSTQALSCQSSTDYIAGKNCVKSCPTGSDPWPAKHRCVPCGTGKYLNLETGECADPNFTPDSANYLRIAGHQRTAAMVQKPDVYNPIKTSATSSLDCVTQCVEAYREGRDKGGYYYNFNLFNSYYRSCECHRFFEASPQDPPYAQRYTAGHETDYVTLGSSEAGACSNADNIPQYKALFPGYTSCIQVFFAGPTCYIYGTKSFCASAFS